MVHDQDFFIPKSSVISILDSAARVTGDRNIGLSLSPYMDFANYGIWGRYITTAPTLQMALQRIRSSLKYHSSNDEIPYRFHGDLAMFAHRSSVAGHQRYFHVATATAALLVNLFRSYLGPDWIPEQIDLDFTKPEDRQIFEHVFECPVTFDCDGVGIWFRSGMLAQSQRKIRADNPITIFDVKGNRVSRIPTSVVELVAEMTRAQLQDGYVSLEKTAFSMGMGVRRLQRAIAESGTGFREITNAIRLQQASELLFDSTMTVAEISDSVGYSVPSHFIRSFKNMTGMTPGEYRQNNGEIDILAEVAN